MNNKNAKRHVYFLFFILGIMAHDLFAGVWIHNTTKHSFMIEIRPVGSTQYTKACMIEQFSLQADQTKKLSDAQGNYACPDIVVSLWHASNSDHRVEQRLKLSGYDFEGSRDAPVAKDEVIRIVQRGKAFSIELTE